MADELKSKFLSTNGLIILVHYNDNAALLFLEIAAVAGNCVTERVEFLSDVKTTKLGLATKIFLLNAR